ncbi:MAG: Uma2 family endonuclease [Verrucomicrobia bacterium]|nr:Uma2 family endonuclease [Verrucomicrobiota bacterium]
MPITIQLPELRSQTAFNLARWRELVTDPELAMLPNRIETDRHGHIIMSPPPAARHSRRQAKIASLLDRLLPDGTPFTECAISTADGVKATDVAWLAHERSEVHDDSVVLTRAPEICVEILSPSNTQAEIDEKRALYFDAGAIEVWICNFDGSMSFFSGVNHQIPGSVLCTAFPDRIP